MKKVEDKRQKCIMITKVVRFGNWNNVWKLRDLAGLKNVKNNLIYKISNKIVLFFQVTPQIFLQEHIGNIFESRVNHIDI